MKLYHSYISLTELYENVTKIYLAVCIELEFLVSVATFHGDTARSCLDRQIAIN